MSSRPLGIVCALSAEVKTLTSKSIGIGTVIDIADDVWLTLSGIGAQRAYTAAKLMLHNGAAALLSWGSAGALDEKLSLGNLLLPKTVFSADGQALPVTQDWHEHFYRKLATRFTLHTEPLIETSTVLTTARQRHVLRAGCNAIATDMETAALAKLAKEVSVPFLTLRAVSDTTQMVLPEHLLETVNSVGELPLQHILTKVVFQPRDWFAIAKLAWGMHMAQTSLRQVIKYIGPGKLAAPNRL